MCVDMYVKTLIFNNRNSINFWLNTLGLITCYFYYVIKPLLFSESNLTLCWQAELDGNSVFCLADAELLFLKLSKLRLLNSAT